VALGGTRLPSKGLRWIGRACGRPSRDSACEGIDTVEEFCEKRRKEGAGGKKERWRGGRNLDGKRGRRGRCIAGDLDISKHLLTTRVRVYNKKSIWKRIKEKLFVVRPGFRILAPGPNRIQGDKIAFLGSKAHSTRLLPGYFVGV